MRKRDNMSYRELCVSQSNVLGGFQNPFEEARYVILGVPFDVTSTYRTGARFGPSAIREASVNIETFSFRSNIDAEDLKLHDMGDLHVLTDTTKTLERLEQVIREIVSVGKVPVTIGGEHTITLGITKGLSPKASNLGVVSFDAHLDLRNEYSGLRLSHTTYMRRINEEVKPVKIVEVGTRAVCREEKTYAEKAGIEFVTTDEISKKGTGQTVLRLKEMLASCRSIYLSVDMDVLDPAYAPAVQNPEPGGLDFQGLFDITCKLCDQRVIGFDVLEVAPHYDQGISSIAAAKVIFETLCCLERSRK